MMVRIGVKVSWPVCVLAASLVLLSTGCAPERPSPLTVLEDAANAMARAGATHFRMQVRFEEELIKLRGDASLRGLVGFPDERHTATLSFAGDFQAPDRTHGFVTSSDGEIEMVTIGRSTYRVDSAHDRWGKSTKPVTPLGSPARFIVPDVLSTQDLALLGEEYLDGARVYHLRGIMLVEEPGYQVSWRWSSGFP